MQWRFTLPQSDPTPTQNGSSVANFELFTTFWISLDLCDPTSNPFGSCTPVSDANNPTTAGISLLELQFYPPGIARSQTSWSVTLTIDSVHSNNACPEPVSLADITADGNPASPSFLMSNGDDIIVTLKDTTSGLRVDVNDVTANRTGFMVASGANGFFHIAPVNAQRGSCSLNHATLCTTNADCPAGQGTCSFCQTEAFDYHPMYSTASADRLLALVQPSRERGVRLRNGPWELCGNSTCSILPDADSDDAGCSTIAASAGVRDPTSIRTA